jgi:hypothetical protein
MMEMFIVPFAVVAFGYMALFGVRYFRYQGLLASDSPDGESSQQQGRGSRAFGWEPEQDRQRSEQGTGTGSSREVIDARRAQDDYLWRITYAWLMAVASLVVLVQVVNVVGLQGEAAWPYALMAGPLLVLSTETAFRARSLQGSARVMHIAGAIIASPALTLGVAILFGK